MLDDGAHGLHYGPCRSETVAPKREWSSPSELAGVLVARHTLFHKVLQFLQQRRVQSIEIEAGLSLHALLQCGADITQQLGEIVDRHEVNDMLAARDLHCPEELRLALGVEVSAVCVEVVVFIVHNVKPAPVGNHKTPQRGEQVGLRFRCGAVRSGGGLAWRLHEVCLERNTMAEGCGVLAVSG